MKQRPRRYITDSEMALIWDRWEKGDSINAIARDLGRYHSAVQGAMARTGGIRPSARRRSCLALTLAEREEISRGIVVGHSMRAIASQLGRAPSTVSREIRRNGGRRWYRASKADEAARERELRPKTCKLAQNPALARIVAKKLISRWSPWQIAYHTANGRRRRRTTAAAIALKISSHARPGNLIVYTIGISSPRTMARSQSRSAMKSANCGECR